MGRVAARKATADLRPTSAHIGEIASSVKPLKTTMQWNKGLLQFEEINESGWQWSVLHFETRSTTRKAISSSLSEQARSKVNDRRNRFSWTGLGSRDIEDKRVWVAFEDDTEAGWKQHPEDSATETTVPSTPPRQRVHSDMGRRTVVDIEPYRD